MGNHEETRRDRPAAIGHDARGLRAAVAVAAILAAATPAFAAPKAESALSGAKPLPAAIRADDGRIQYTGRIDFSDPAAPAFAFSATEIRARFTGRSLDVVLSDRGDRNYFQVTVDGGAPIVIRSARGEKVHPIARKLKRGIHDVRIVKRTEGNCGVAAFLGFRLDKGADLADPAPLQDRRVEFIGDSITCGYGNMGSTTEPDKFHFTPENENAALSWGFLTAEALGARYVSVSYSGRGMFRNLDGKETGTLPAIYGSVYPDAPADASWDHALYRPDLIVINLGTNDYGSQLARADLSDEAFDQAYVAAYLGFIERLRALHGPDAFIVCAVGPMMSDWYPQGKRAWTRVRTAVQYVVDKRAEGGDERIAYLELAPQNSPYGEDWHPTAATHARMAEDALEAVREATGW